MLTDPSCTIMLQIGIPLWRMFADGIVTSHGTEHLQNLELNMDGLDPVVEPVE